MQILIIGKRVAKLFIARVETGQDLLLREVAANSAGCLPVYFADGTVQRVSFNMIASYHPRGSCALDSLDYCIGQQYSAESCGRNHR